MTGTRKVSPYGVPPCSALPRCHVLVVDDDPAIALALGEVIEAYGHRVSVANHANRALEIDGGTPADVLVTDLNMPDIDGQELIRRLRATRPELPVIVLTGRPPLGGVRTLRGDDDAPTELLCKPATPVELNQALDRLIGLVAR